MESVAPAGAVSGDNCPACGDEGTYWEDRVAVHDSVVGFEIRDAGIEHPDGRVCREW